MGSVVRTISRASRAVLKPIVGEKISTAITGGSLSPIILANRLAGQPLGDLETPLSPIGESLFPNAAQARREVEQQLEDLPLPPVAPTPPTPPPASAPPLATTNPQDAPVQITPAPAPPVVPPETPSPVIAERLPGRAAQNAPLSPRRAPRVGGDTDTPAQRARRASTRQRAGVGRRAQTLLTSTLGAPQSSGNVRTTVLGG